MTSTSQSSTKMTMVKITQVNLHHSKAASAALMLRMAERGEELALVQEPWIASDRVCGLRAKDYMLLHAAGSGKIRSCIVASRKLSIFILSDFSDEDTVVAALETTCGTVYIVSSYMAHDHSEPPPNAKVRAITKAANDRNIPLVIGADANAHHIFWGSSDTNARGESIFNFILCSSLDVLNIGKEPTFVVSNRREVLDITLVSTKHFNMIREWKVSNDCSFSDHMYIDFNLEVHLPGANPILNRRKTNWIEQHDILSQLLPNPPTICTSRDIESSVELINNAFDRATSVACRPKVYKGRSKPHWWNSEIGDTRKECRRLFNEAKRLVSLQILSQ